jgi:hypothetical protein
LSQEKRVRIFLDSNVLTSGIVSTWGLDKTGLSLCAARICRLVLAEAVDYNKNRQVWLLEPDIYPMALKAIRTASP